MAGFGLREGIGTVRVAFCGIGNMGAPMAGRLVAAGHQVTVWNRTPERAVPLVDLGAIRAETPAGAARGSEVTMTMLSDGAALDRVLFGSNGVAEGLEVGSGLIDLSTVGPRAILDVAERLRPGIAFLDAPVKGGPTRAESGDLKLLVGGTDEAYQRFAPVLRAMGTPSHVGPLGSGSAAKVLNNTIVIDLVSVLGEALALADALDLGEDLALEVIRGTPLQATLDHQWPRITGESPPSFRLSLAAKDLALGVEAGGEAGAQVGIGRVALERLREAESLDMGDEDQARVVNLIRGARKRNDPT